VNGAKDNSVRQVSRKVETDLCVERGEVCEVSRVFEEWG
jgi:hypothetical protein